MIHFDWQLYDLRTPGEEAGISRKDAPDENIQRI